MKKISITTLWIKSITAFFSLLIVVGVSYAQGDLTTSENAIRDLNRPLSDELKKKFKTIPEPAEIVEEKPPVEAAAPETRFFVKEIVIKGAESIPLEEFKSLLEKYEDREVSLTELNTLADEIKRVYLKHGILAACFVPPQNIVEGKVILQIVEAKMGELTIDGGSPSTKKNLRRYWRIASGEILNYNALSRSLTLMNKNPDRKVKATLHAGKTPGTTDVLLNVKMARPIHLIGTIDKEGSYYTGLWKRGVGIIRTNFLGLDDIAVGGYLFSDHYSALYAYHKIPMNARGTAFSYSYVYAKAFPKKDYVTFGIDSRIRDSSVSIHQDLFNNNDYLGEVFFELNCKDKSTNTDTGTLNRDRLRVLRLGSSLNFKNRHGITTIEPTIAQGINGLGAQERSPLTSREASNVFTKFNFNGEHVMLFLKDCQLKVTLKGQTASAMLTPQEEFSLGGIDSVRGYPAGDFLADHAIQTNIELSVPFSFIPDTVRLFSFKKPVKENVAGILFFDYGYGQKRGATPSEQPSYTLKSVGTGLRIKLFDMVSLRLEWGFPLGFKPINQTADSRFHFSVEYKI